MNPHWAPWQLNEQSRMARFSKARIAGQGLYCLMASSTPQASAITGLAELDFPGEMSLFLSRVSAKRT